MKACRAQAPVLMVPCDGRLLMIGLCSRLCAAIIICNHITILIEVACWRRWCATKARHWALLPGAKMGCCAHSAFILVRGQVNLRPNRRLMLS